MNDLIIDEQLRTLFLNYNECDQFTYNSHTYIKVSWSTLYDIKTTEYIMFGIDF